MIKKLIASAALAFVAVPALATSAFASSSSAPVNPYAGQTSWSQVAPNGLQGTQVWTNLTPAQKVRAREVVEVAYQRHMPPYAAVIAVSTALQESKFVNYTHSVDHQSLGIFQQQPDEGWGSASQVEDPSYAAGAFLSALSHYNYMSMNDTDAAQAVQRSADPYAYAQWEKEATVIVSQISNGTF